jgi:hypothetical protein
MPTTIEIHPLRPCAMGNQRSLTVLRYGERGGGPKAYIQAGLHADEPPGFLVMHHLRTRLERLAVRGAIRGEILLVPLANPIGVTQWRDDLLQGRFEFASGVNFNRRHPDLTERVAAALGEQLEAHPERNTALIRAAIRSALQAMTPLDEGAALKHLLLTLAHDADIVLDLHCDCQAVLHLYLGTPLWPNAADLAAQLGAALTLLAGDSGVTPFDEACSRIWWRLAERFPRRPIPPACLAATVELRGSGDVRHELAAADADNIVAFLQRRGLIAGAPPALPEACGEAIPLTGVAHLTAAAPGVVVFLKQPGDRVSAGEVVAEVIDPTLDGPHGRVAPLASPIDGLLFARCADRYARPGRILAKIAGGTPLRSEGGDLLTA